jgi:hypothetical protein
MLLYLEPKRLYNPTNSQEIDECCDCNNVGKLSLVWRFELHFTVVESAEIRFKKRVKLGAFT